MDKSEFLNILGQTLNGEISPADMEQNLSYYGGYISSQGRTEEDVIAELGDPRLIAKTIIETDKIAREKSQGGWNQDGYQRYRQEEGDYQENVRSYQQNHSMINIKWYHKLMAVGAGILLLVTVAMIGRFVMGLLFAFGLPIILILLLATLFRRR